MKTSEQINELAAALAKAQGELAGAKKDVSNTFFKSKYADLASIVDALKACFPKHGLSYVQTTVVTEHGAGVQTRLMHSSGQFIEGEPFCLPVNKADAQGFGSCVTYARRYDLAAMTGVAPEDDDGNAAAQARPNTATQVAHDEFDKLKPEEKAIVREWAVEIIADVKAGNVGRAIAFAAEKCTTQEDQMALWSQLPSDVRSKMKAAKQAAAVTA